MQNSVQQVTVYPRLGLSTGSFWLAGCWKWWNSPACLSCARRHRWAGASPVPWLRLHQGQLTRAFPHLLACHCLRRGTLGPAHSPGKVWKWLCVMPKSWADDTSGSRSCGAGDVNDGESRASRLPLSVIFYCSAAHAPGKGAELTLIWVQTAAFWLMQQQFLRELPLLLVAQTHS